ncbi:MAG: L-aspartate oxidase [Verrucomicrobia bacterium]|nr:L-aspartate oxidase [Verrucomicrobiota bacterium]MBU4289630.1 L-aspartate oxidase [Verrucomicrobiota bacterium]MBU4430147.1 L-aspartate oxidase [Verrucomicrobiota bacterium]MCG2679494.1 L-aspartate oxidase [Kiritimatiellia bacterium]
MDIIDFDYLVIGSGIAGLMSAIHLSAHGRVCVLTKKDSAESNTNYAQGGIACVVTSDDSFEEHVKDTLIAGDGLCDEAVVRAIVSAGPERIAELEQIGLKFTGRDQAPGSGYDLGREGGHSRRRVLHCGDITGREVERILVDQVRSRPGVRIMEHCMVIDLVTTGWMGMPGSNRCVGCYFLNQATGEIAAVRAPFTVMATGGGGKVYLYTSNPDIATGDGLALAWRAGASMRNLEFIQFHPTCLYHPQAKSFLISEAVRGEGAILVNTKGESFMERYDVRGSLAPRDIVARAIDQEMKISGSPCVFLDIRHQPVEFLQRRFPNIYRTCLQFGVDMARDLVPVVPAAHFLCGGVEADVDGATALPGLFACGEVACTGLHGANRLASNSLLEALVCAHAMARKVGALPREMPAVSIPSWESGAAVPSDEAVVIEHNWNEVRTCMWDYVGIVRTNKRLERALRRIRNLRREIQQYYYEYLVTTDLLELRNIAAVAELIIRSALLRRESRGLHYTLDYPDKAAVPRDTLIRDPPGGRIAAGTLDHDPSTLGCAL